MPIFLTNLPSLPSGLYTFPEHYTVPCTVHYTVHCTLQYYLQPTLNGIVHCLSVFLYKNGLLFQENYLLCLLFNVVHSLLHTVLYILMYTLIYNILYTHCTLYREQISNLLVEMHSSVSITSLLLYVHCKVYLTMYCLFYFICIVHSTVQCTP